jgi:hypothetical protein
MNQSSFGSHVEAVVHLDSRYKQQDALKYWWMTTIQARRRAGFESCTTIIHLATPAQQDEKLPKWSGSSDSMEIVIL